MKATNETVPRILQTLLRLRRPHGSVEETIAGQTVLDYVSAYPWVSASTDKHGNIVCQIGKDNGVVFTAHLDTVHNSAGTQELFVLELEQGMFLGAEHLGKESVLGADDAAGIYLLMELMQAQVQGKYMFFVGEECGGIGSSAYVQDNPKFSANMVVSFDRRGTHSVITHQGGWRTCSDEFGNALAKQLNKHGKGKLAYRTDDAGLYTDSREFAEMVAECTNISVGYYHEHTAKETLNLTHLLALRDAILLVDWMALPVQRVPAPDVLWDTYSFGRSSAWYDVPDTGAAELQNDVRTYLDKNWDTVDAKLRQLLLDMEAYLNEQV
ncbi:putative aminopeptidase [Pectobacterium phage PP16]|uniref:Aminopeptidase n=1 Tax=Pectobacterium phage PP16 TaxID=1873958 RepID=A0A1B1PEA3_9CAUD|nr:peptidase [Pectobacterium phage PP16]ANT45310.1 putative aminopeptidase [Pectobacterium phage PP16]